MLHFSIDIRTVILLVVFQQSRVCGCSCSYRRNNRKRQSYRFFLSGSCSVCCVGLLALRGEIPDILSAYLGNTLLFIGFALEAVAITTLDETSSSRTAKRLFAFLAVVGSIAFCLFANTPPLKVVVASVTTAALLVQPLSFWFVLATFRRFGRCSRCFTGVLHYLVFKSDCCPGVIRNNGSYNLAGFAQAITFLTLFLLMFIGTVGLF